MTALLRAIEQGMWRGFVATATTGAAVWCIDKLWKGPK